ncbi:MAG: metalloregulator ArsR/SmtB family transcription factor [Myxococcales bacterium]|nr:metalloregulator ArsR/SmtB family transcription factor [Myxococcales bacterium]
MTDAATLDARFRALAHPARRELVRLCAQREHGTGELAQRTQLRQATTSQHLRVLRDAQLLTVRSEGNRRLYRTHTDHLRGVRDLLDELWGAKLLALKHAAEARALSATEEGS